MEITSCKEGRGGNVSCSFPLPIKERCDIFQSLREIWYKELNTRLGDSGNKSSEKGIEDNTSLQSKLTSKVEEE